MKTSVRAITALAASVTALAIVAGLRGETPVDSSGIWTPTGAMHAGREGASSVLLPDGSVLVTGGRNDSGPVAGGERYSDGIWTALPDVPVQRWAHTATILEDGTILIIGGTRIAGESDQGDPLAGPTATIERFDPATGEVTPAGLLAAPRTGHAATRLLDGRVLVAGGFDGQRVVADVEIFDPETGTLTAGVDMLQARAGLSATTLIDGRVLLAGGNDGTDDLAIAEVYDVAGGVVASGAMSVARRDHQAVLLPHNNHVLIVGGVSNGQPAGAELYRSWAGQFVAAASPSVNRVGATAVALAREWPYMGLEGQLLLAGGASSVDVSEASAERYTFATIRTDKDDYVPGDVVYVSGMGWQPNETITFGLREMPAEHEARSFSLTADSSGRIPNQPLFDVEDHHLGVRFFLTARGVRSQAQVTFTDGPKVGSVDLTTQNPSPVTAGQSATYNVTVRRGTGPGSNGTFTATLQALNLPSGATASFAPNTVAFTASENSKEATLTVSTAGTMTGGTSPFTVRAATSANDFAERPTSLVVTASAKTPQTITFTPPSDKTFGDAPFALSATGGASGEPVTFAVISGPGSLTGSSILTLTGAGSVVVRASQSGNEDYVAATPVDRTITVAKAPTTTTLTCTGAPFTYSGAAQTPCTATVTGAGGLNEPLTVSYGNNVNAGTATASATYAESANHLGSSDSKTFEISKATATVTLGDLARTYTGSTLAPTATTAPAGLALTWSLAPQINAGSYPVTATVTDNNYEGSASGTFVINKAATTTTVTCTGSPFTYSGAAQTPCTATVTGAGGLNESPTVSYTNNVNAGTATASATYAESANHLGSTGSTTFVINKADAVISVTGYTGVYDGQPHGASGAATGLGGAALAGLDLGESFTNVPGGTATWTFTDVTGNYNDATGTAAIVITKADAAVTVTGFTGVYDGQAHGASGTATGVGGATLAGLDLGESFTNVPGGTATWTFTDVTGNYNDASGTVAILIDRAPTSTTVTCAAGPFTYSGAAQTPCTATVTGAGGLNESPTVSYGNNVNAGTATASATYAESANHLGSTGSTTFVINKATATVTLGDLLQTYTGSALSPSATTAPAGLALTWTGTPQTNAGSYAVTATVTDNNYEGTASGTFVIDKAPAPVTLTNLLQAFTGSGLRPTVATSPAGLAVAFQFSQDTPKTEFDDFVTAAGVYKVVATIVDPNYHGGAKDMFVIYDPNGGFVTGGGWIMSGNNACTLTTACTAATGRANFGFTSKYQKGAKVPTGQTQFQFQAGGLNFHSTDYEWLVVSGARAQYKGTGTINGAGGFGFLLTSVDGQVTGGGGVDKFRIKIWRIADGEVVYDNQRGATDTADVATAISSGSIVIHDGGAAKKT